MIGYQVGLASCDLAQLPLERDVVIVEAGIGWGLGKGAKGGLCVRPATNNVFAVQ
jgi:hypothetical protein